MKPCILPSAAMSWHQWVRLPAPNVFCVMLILQRFALWAKSWHHTVTNKGPIVHMLCCRRRSTTEKHTKPNHRADTANTTIRRLMHGTYGIKPNEKFLVEGWGARENKHFGLTGCNTQWHNNVVQWRNNSKHIFIWVTEDLWIKGYLKRWAHGPIGVCLQCVSMVTVWGLRQLITPLTAPLSFLCGHVTLHLPKGYE